MAVIPSTANYSKEVSQAISKEVSKTTVKEEAPSRHVHAKPNKPIYQYNNLIKGTKCQVRLNSKSRPKSQFDKATVKEQVITYRQ